MRDRWEESLEKLCGSPEEEIRLKETASLFGRLPEPHCSLSFRQELREKLLAEAARKGRQANHRRGILLNLQEKFAGNKPWWRTRSFGIVAAGVLLFFLSLTIFNNPAPGSQGPLAINEEHGETSMFAEAGTSMPDHKKPPAQPPVEQAATAEKPDLPGVMPESGSQAPTPAAQTGPPSGGNPAAPAPQPTEPANEPATTPALPAEPEFDLFKHRRTFTLAGNLVLNYGPLADVLYPVENINVNWEPNKIAPAATPDINLFGTPEWAGRLLALEGFRIKTGESVSVSVKETTQGLYAEIVYHVSPALILHVHETKGIIAYYYQESGAVAPEGYYALMAPANALKQLQGLKSPVADQQLRFSFREVKLAYHDFLLEEEGSTKTVRLPAYCFTGSELLQGKEGVTFHLPAVAVK